MAPLLAKISEYTGFTAITLMGGTAPAKGRDSIVGFVHHGETNESLPRNFSAFDNEGFRRNVVSQFFKFLRHTAGEFDARTVGGHTAHLLQAQMMRTGSQQCRRML